MTGYEILLTGVTGKFGRVLTKHFINQGHRVIGTSRSRAKLAELPFKLGIDPDRFNKYFTGIEVDLGLSGATSAIIDTLRSKNIHITHLINNARNREYLMTEPDGTVSAENFTGEFILDVVVPYALSMRLVDIQKEQLRQIINIGSQYGTVATNISLYDRPEAGSAIHYSVAKAALAHLTKELGVRLAKRQIQVNCISYGGVIGRVDKVVEQRYALLCPIGRMLNEEDIVRPIEMLISHPSMIMTGQTIHADGGWSLW